MAAPAPKPKIELVVVDLDGTLLNSTAQITKRVETAIKTAAAQGIKFVFATGKTRGSAVPLLEQLNVDTAGIYVQGTVTYNGDGGIRHQTTLSDAVVRQVITFAEDRGFVVALYSGSRIMLRVSNQLVEDNMRHYREVAPEHVGPLMNQIGSTPINKVIAMGEPRAITSLRWQLNLQLGATARVLQAGVPTMLEVVPTGVSKGSALKRLASDLRIAPEHIMAIGDAENDIEMLQFAGIGIAMGNADAAVKAAAKHVVASNNEDGVAEALEKFVIVKPEPPKPEAAASAPAPAPASPKPEPAAAKPVGSAAADPPADSAAPKPVSRKPKPADDKADKPDDKTDK